MNEDFDEMERESLAAAADARARGLEIIDELIGPNHPERDAFVAKMDLEIERGLARSRASIATMRRLVEGGSVLH